MPRRENTFRVDYSQFPKLLSHDEIHKFVAKELGLTRENVLLLQPCRRLGCTFVKVNSLELAEKIVEQHDGKHEFVFDGKSYKLRVTMEDGAVEVKLLELPDGVTNDQISDFLDDYGEVLNVRDLLWDDRYSEFGGVTTGVRVARMVVTKNIPSLVTIQGEETAVGYKGQRQTCLHCHEFAHIGIPCVQNKKLLVQKLVADQSYANVAKGRMAIPTPAKVSSNPVGPRKSTAVTASGSVKVGQPSSSGVAANLLRVSEINSANKQSKTTMPPPAAMTLTKPSGKQPTIQLASLPMSFGTAPYLLRKDRKDGYETDSSQTSLTSNGSRKHKKPAGKKMKPGEETTTTTTIENEHDRDSDESMKQ